MLADLLICLSTLLAVSATDSPPLWHKETLLLHRPLSELLMGISLLCSWHLSLVAGGAYRSHRLSSWFKLAAVLVKSSLLTTACAAVWSLWHILASSPRVASLRTFLWEGVAFFAVNFALLFSSRLIARVTLGLLRKRGRNLRHVLVVGSNARAIAAAEFLTSHGSLGYRLAGFVDDSWHSPEVPPAFANMLVGDRSTLPDLLRTIALDEVLIALPIASHYETIRGIVAHCREQGIIARWEGSLFDLDGTAPRPDCTPSLITLHEKTWSQSALLFKRLLDIAVSSVALIVLAPLLLLIAISIKATSPGPVFFLQTRIGMGKRRFKIFKFRTMVQDAEKLLRQVEHLNEAGGPTFKLSNDPRITPVGHLLRKTSLDELPQFINVLIGDMSLVGPRPLPVRDYDGFSEDWHRRRFSVKPGITCLWQIMGRSSITFDRWMELDMSYIDTWSLWLDLKILLQTIPVVLRGSGAM